MEPELRSPVRTKYRMRTPHPLADLFARIRPAPDALFETAKKISILISPGECPEEKADRLRHWCGANCVGRWRPLERWTNGAVRIEFEHLTDAMICRLAN